MKAGALVAKIFGKVGINTSDPKYSELVSIATEIPDEDANKIFSSLMTIEDAKQNLDLKNWWTKAAMDGVDGELNKIMDEMGVEVTDRDEVKAVSSTFQRIGKLAKKISDLEKKKAGASTGEKKDLQDKINEATNKIVQLEATHKEEVKRLNSEWQGKLTNSTIRSIFAGKKYANTNIPIDVNIETAMVLLNKELEKKRAKIINTPSGLKLVHADDETLDWLNSANEKPSVEQFFDGFLAENKLLAVNEPAGTHTPPQLGYVPPPGNYNNAQPINGNGGPTVNRELMAEANSDYKALMDSLEK